MGFSGRGHFHIGEGEGLWPGFLPQHSCQQELGREEGQPEPNRNGASWQVLGAGDHNSLRLGRQKAKMEVRRKRALGTGQAHSSVSALLNSNSRCKARLGHVLKGKRPSFCRKSMT